MEDFIAILSLLIITGLFTVGFIFKVFLKGPSPTVDKVQRMVVADMIESLRKICPVGAKKGWTLTSINYSSPRNWKRQFLFPVSEAENTLHGSSAIVKSPASVVKDLIAKPAYWDEWDSFYFSCSMSLCENKYHELREDKYMKCVLVNKRKKSQADESSTLMYCFMNLPFENVRWILFWNVTYLNWWFFLIQPAMRKSDANHCLLTVIQGTDAVSSEDEVARAVRVRIRNIRDAAESHSFKVFPFNPVVEHSFSPHVDHSESIKPCNSCKKAGRAESCSREHFTEKRNPEDVLLQLVSSSDCNPAVYKRSKKFNICLIDARQTHTIQNEDNSECNPHHHETGCNMGREYSSTVMATEKASGPSDPKKPRQKISNESQIVNTVSSTKNSLVLHERSRSVIGGRADSPISHNEKNVSGSKSKNLDSQNVSPKPKESDSGIGAKRKPSFAELRRKFSGISSVGSHKKSATDTSATVLMGSEFYLDENSDFLTSDSSTAVNAAIKKSNFDEDDYIFPESDKCGGSFSDLTTSGENSERVLLSLNSSPLSSDKISTCEGNCSPICDVCLKVAYQELSDFEVLLPRLEISEERIADLVTKGNYCASELQAEVHKASQVKMSGNSERKTSGVRWRCVSSNKDVDLFLKTKEEGSLKIISYLCQTSLPVSPNRAWDVIRNPRLRFICDETSKKVTVLEELPEQQKIIYTYHEFGGLLKKEAIDFCLLHSERVEHLKYSLAYISIEYENCPWTSAVRGMLFPSGWVIEKLEESSDECRISYLIQVVVNRPDSLLVQESSNIVLQSVHNLRNYMSSAPENMR